MTETPDLLRNYSGNPAIYDEMMDAGSGVRPHWQQFLDGLAAMPGTELLHCWDTAQRLVRRVCPRCSGPYRGDAVVVLTRCAPDREALVHDIVEQQRLRMPEERLRQQHTHLLAALHERQLSGRGQSITIALMDSAVSGLINVAQAALSGHTARRYGNAHPTIVPYQTFLASDRSFAVAVGNDAQWQRLCTALDLPELGADPRLATNPGRVEHRTEVVTRLSARLADMVGAGPVHTLISVTSSAFTARLIKVRTSPARYESSVAHAGESTRTRSTPSPALVSKASRAGVALDPTLVKRTTAEFHRAAQIDAASGVAR